MLFNGLTFLLILLAISTHGFSIALPEKKAVLAQLPSPDASLVFNSSATKEKVHLEWKCIACKLAVGAFRTMLKARMSFEQMTAIYASLCETFHIEKPDVCIGTAREFLDEASSVIQNATLSVGEICSFILGPTCSSDFYERFKWNVTFPDIPKPPVFSQASPHPGAPKLRVLQLSDLHVDFRYRPGSNAVCGKPLCCQNDDVPNAGKFVPAGKWGSYSDCDTPPWTLENLFQQLSVQKPFDYILWTGDQLSHRVWDMSRPELLHGLSFITNLFTKYFPGVPVFPAVGNHESVPVNSFPPSYITGNRSIDWLYDALVKSWTSWLPNYTALTIGRGGYYTYLLKPGFRIVSINMNYCNNQNFWLMFNTTDPMGELKWLINILQNAELVGEKVHIIGHIPPGSPDCEKWWSWNYYTIVNRYESVIAGQFFGHTHVDSWQLMYDSADGFKRPVSVVYVCPSITPFTQLNMGYRVYELDGFYANSSWAVLDHETFILNLTEANMSDQQPRWVHEYSAKETYNMKSLTPADWDLVLTKMKTDDNMFANYYKFYNKLHPTSLTCDESCRKNMLCEVKSGRSYDPQLCDDLFNQRSTDQLRHHGNGYRNYLSWLQDKKAC